jgi:hypothetical protein
MQSIFKLAMLLLAFSLAQVSFARRDRRDGFNFGTTVKLVDTDDRRYAVGDATRDSRSERTMQSFTPYVGYAFAGALNLGLAATLQHGTEKMLDTAKDGQDEISREISASLNAGNLFARRLFGKVMFMELGVGLYSEQVSATTEFNSLLADGTYSGRREHSKTQSMGMGYHGGIGAELEMGAGFFFTSSFLTRVYHLKEVKGGDMGAKTGYQQNRELNFGLAYYY